jgi:hypothetical protein
MLLFAITVEQSWQNDGNCILKRRFSKKIAGRNFWRAWSVNAIDTLVECSTDCAKTHMGGTFPIALDQGFG